MRRKYAQSQRILSYSLHSFLGLRTPIRASFRSATCSGPLSARICCRKYQLELPAEEGHAFSSHFGRHVGVRLTLKQAYNRSLSISLDPVTKLYIDH